MSRQFSSGLGVNGARAVAAAVGVAVAAGAALLAAIGGLPGWLRITLGAMAFLVAVAVVGLTWAEQTSGPRTRTRRLKMWVEDHFQPRGRGVARKGELGQYFTGRARALNELAAWLGEKGRVPFPG
jgi:hypothetical protein